MLHGYRLFSEEIFNEYAAQTMFFQSQAFPPEKKPEKAKFCLAFFDFQKKPKVFKKSQNIKIWLQKSQIGNPGGKTPTTVTSSAPSQICCHVIVTQQRPIVEQFAPQFRNLPLQAKKQIK